MARISFGTARAAPGQKSWGRLRVAEGKKSVSLPAIVINGARPGPHACLLANQHGTETVGIESIRRACERIDPALLRGTVFAVPSANPMAAVLGKPVWNEGDPGPEPEYRSPYNMNFNWPGRPGGRWVERAVHEIWTRAIMAPHRKADLVLDLHCYAEQVSAVYAGGSDAVELGVASGLRGVVNMRFEAGGEKMRREGIRPCTNACAGAGIPALCIELCNRPAMRQSSITEGETAILNLLKLLGMLPGRMALGPEAVVLDPWRNDFEKRSFAHPSYLDYKPAHDGLFIPIKRHYDIVRRGETVGRVLDPFTAKIVEECAAPMAGGLYHLQELEAPCKKGSGRLFTVAVHKRVVPPRFLEKIRGKYPLAK